jgi:hypothetical protein
MTRSVQQEPAATVLEAEVVKARAPVRAGQVQAAVGAERAAVEAQA